MSIKVLPWIFASFFSLIFFWILSSFQAEITLSGREISIGTWLVTILLSTSPLLLLSLVYFLKKILSKKDSS